MSPRRSGSPCLAPRAAPPQLAAAGSAYHDVYVPMRAAFEATLAEVATKPDLSVPLQTEVFETKPEERDEVEGEREQ